MQDSCQKVHLKLPAGGLFAVLSTNSPKPKVFRYDRHA